MNTKEQTAIHEKCIGILEMIESFHHKRINVLQSYKALNRLFPTKDNSKYVHQLDIIDRSMERLEMYYKKQVKKLVLHL